MLGRFEVGEWVRIDKRAGWVVSTEHPNSTRVFFVDKQSMEWINNMSLESHEQVLPEAQENARQAFIDMALDAYDSDWFKDETEGI